MHNLIGVSDNLMQKIKKRENEIQNLIEVNTPQPPQGGLYKSAQIKIKTYTPAEELPGFILPQQVHRTKIVEIITGKEDLSECDGIWTKDKTKLLGIKTADCAPIAFYDKEKFGIIHAGWHGLCDGIIEKMLEEFENPQIFVGPFLPKFQIQKDFCYDKIVSKFGKDFLSGIEEEEILIFDFKSAIQSIIPNAQFDERSTFHELDLASWRRDQDERRNVTVIRTL